MGRKKKPINLKSTLGDEYELTVKEVTDILTTINNLASFPPDIVKSLGNDVVLQELKCQLERQFYETMSIQCSSSKLPTLGQWNLLKELFETIQQLKYFAKRNEQGQFDHIHIELDPR